MILNIYNKNTIIKTYEAENYDIKFGVVEDVIELFDMDELQKGDDIELIKLVGKTIPKSLGSIKDLMKDIFDGLTDEELPNVKIKEMAQIIVTIIKYALSQISDGISKKK